MSDENAYGQGNTGAGGGQDTSFLDGFTNEELKGNEAFSSFENLDAFGQNHIDLKTAHDELKTAHDELKASLPQVPENVDGYTLEGLPEGIELDQADQGVFKELALKHKISNETFQELVKFDLARAEKAANEANEAKEAALQEIKDSFGDNYEAERLKAEKVLKVAAQGDEFFEELNIEDYPKMFKVISYLGGLISEDSLRTGGQNIGQGGAGDKSAESVLFGDMPGLPKEK